MMLIHFASDFVTEVFSRLTVTEARISNVAHGLLHITLGSAVVGRWTCDREVASSTPGRCIAGQPRPTQTSIPPG